MELLLATLTTYFSEYFLIALVWIVAAMLALSHWQRHPKASGSFLVAALFGQGDQA
jgi:hypothetical protein